MLYEFKQQGQVTAITFRTDEEPLMATASLHGDIAIWDLDKTRLAHTMTFAHYGPIHSIQFFNKQPILISSGSDNAIKQWIFDRQDHVPRLLKQRSGHFEPPSMVRYYGEEGRWILSGGRDRSVRLFSTLRDSQSSELSQGSIEKKARRYKVEEAALKYPPLVHFGASTTREKDWDNLLTVHQGESCARTWNTVNKVVGKHAMASQDKASVKCVHVSLCGNFGFLGLSSGRVDMFNMQSGQFRKTFVSHAKSVTGIATDAVNRYLVTASVDGTVKVWSIKMTQVLVTISVVAPVAALRFFANNELAAVACDDLCLRIVDVQTQKLVRAFYGHQNRITDFVHPSCHV
jgi:U3 small nucleolar RNA-associated protein 21